MTARRGHAVRHGVEPVELDRNRYLTPAELLHLRRPYVRRPRDDAEPVEWVQWAKDVLGEVDLARRILDTADAKKAGRYP